MDKLSKVKWTWNYGKVNSELEYESGKKETRKNDHPPPTKACHDVAHFICGFNGNLDWDYEEEYNHIAEYNAVFVESILTDFSHSHYYNYPLDLKTNVLDVNEHMRWFAEDYYFISENHPSQKNYLQLKDNILSKLDLNIVCKYFSEFYHMWLVEEICKSEKFVHSIVMDSSIDYEFDLLYNHLDNLRSLLVDTN